MKIRHGCSPVNSLHIFRTAFFKNTSGGLLLKLICIILIRTKTRQRINALYYSRDIYLCLFIFDDRALFVQQAGHV